MTLYGVTNKNNEKETNKKKKPSHFITFMILPDYFAFLIFMFC